MKDLAAGEWACSATCEGWTCMVLARCAPRCAAHFETEEINCYAIPARPTLTFTEWIALHGSHILYAGIYAPQLWLWRRYFGSSLLLLSFEHLTGDNPAESLVRLATHAGIRPFPPSLLTSLGRGNENTGATSADMKHVSCDLQRSLQSYYEPVSDGTRTDWWIPGRDVGIL